MPPASRVGDMHVCPMVTGIVPHVGGPVLPPGCPTVLIGGMPAARVTDMCVCVGPPDVIAKGSPTVLIGGLMAARIGDNTAHGGVLVMGFPTVMIGESGSGESGQADAFGIGAVLAIAVAAAVGIYAAAKLLSKTESYSKGIKIEGSPEFRKQTRESLDRLKATPTGKALLEDLDKSGKEITIKETSANNGTCKRLSDDANRNSDGTPGTGSGSDIAFNPNFKPGGLPNEVVLGHELMHAQHNAHGERETGFTGGVKDEELKTVGLPPFPSTGSTENSLRNDLGLPSRTSY